MFDLTEETEKVVLLDADGTAIGTADKATVHTEDTPLHLAFSCWVFDSRGRVLLTRRALSKRTWPGVWTNSFCGHPGPDETLADAIRRRAVDELGIEVAGVEEVLPEFRYRATDASGLVENEICPVFRAVTLDDIAPNPDEVSEYQWIEPNSLAQAVRATPFAFSPWLGWELEAWVGFPRVPKR